MMMKSGKILGIVIVLFWIIMMGLLLKKNLFVGSNFIFEEKYLVNEIESREEWAGLYLKGQKIGYSFSRNKKNRRRLQNHRKSVYEHESHGPSAEDRK